MSETDEKALREENARLRAAIAWACGYTDFAGRPDGGGAYWWRTELRERAGITHEEMQRAADEALGDSERGRER